MTESKPRTFGDLLRQASKPTITPPAPPLAHTPRKETPKETQSTAPRPERKRKKLRDKTKPRDRTPQHLKPNSKYFGWYPHEVRAVKRLHIARIDEQHYQVWGGKDTHIITIANELPICDCEASRHGQRCSHAAKYNFVITQRIGVLENTHE